MELKCKSVGDWAKYNLIKMELSWMVPNVNMNGRLSAFGGVIWVPISPSLRGNAFGFFSFPRSSSLWGPFPSLS